MRNQLSGNIAIITARGGSKRIPRKNIKEFLGKPIISYSISAALQAGCFDEVMVSTDDKEIADIARSFGANVPFFRSAETSDDVATTADVLLEVLKDYSDRGLRFACACCIYPTAPFATAEKLLNGYELLMETGAGSVLPVVRFGYPIQRALQIENHRLSMIWPEHMNARSQDLPPAYHDSGQFYWLNVSRFLETRKLFSCDTVPVIVPESEVQDIDSEEDWKLAEMKYCAMLTDSPLKGVPGAAMNKFKTEQECFWAGEFGDGYVERNRGAQLLASNMAFFSKIFSRTERIESLIEFGANIGMNLQAFNALLPNAELSAIEINDSAVHELRKINNISVYAQSIFDFVPKRTWDMVVIKGVLIHINPDMLDEVYKLLYDSSGRYVCIAEYYNPTPVEIVYREHCGMLFKRDFAGDMLNKFSDLKLVDYGFSYHRDSCFPQDDITWFLMEKGQQPTNYKSADSPCLRR